MSALVRMLTIVVLAGTAMAGWSPAAATAGAPAKAAADDVCGALGEAGETSRKHVIGGSKATYDREASLFQVCEGFGAPEDVEFSPAMKCALLAAAATFGGPPVSVPANRLCRAVSVTQALTTKDWLGAVGGEACGYFADVFAGGVAVVAAGATAETGPGAAAVGLATYRLLGAALKVACGGLLDGGAKAVGVKLEADHEEHVAMDILREGKCLTSTRRYGQLRWGAETCPPTAKVVLGRRTGPYQHGLGAAHPGAVSYGGDGLADMRHLHWRNWGGREAFGEGTGAWDWPGQSVATGTVEGPVKVVLSRIRSCHGVRAYTRMVRWMPTYGEHYHAENAIDLCSDKIPDYTDPPSCDDVTFPDGTTATQILVRGLSCADAGRLILDSPAEDFLRSDGGRYMQYGFFCGTDGYPDPSLYTPDPGPSYGCALDQQWLLFALVPAD